MFNSLRGELWMKVVCLTVATALITPTTVWPSSEEATLAPPSSFARKKSELVPGSPFPILVPYRSGEPTEVIFEGRLDNIYGLPQVFGFDFAPKLLEELLAYGEKPIGWGPFKNDLYKEKLWAHLALSIRDTTAWRYAQGYPMPEDAPAHLEPSIRRVLDKYSPEDIQAVVRQINRLEVLADENVTRKQRDAVFAGFAAMTEAQEAALPELLRLGFGENRIAVAMPLMESLFSRRVLRVGSPEYEEQNEKTLVRFLLSDMGDDLKSTGLEILLEDNIDDARRDQYYEKFSEIPPEEFGRMIAAMGATIHENLDKVQSRLALEMIGINAINPNFAPRALQAQLVSNARHPIFINKDTNRMEIDIAYLMSEKPFVKLALLHDMRHAMMHADVELFGVFRQVEEKSRFAVEEIVNILFDYSFLFQRPGLKKIRQEVLDSLRGVGANDYAQLLEELEELSPDDRIHKVITFMLTTEPLKTRFEDKTEADREALAQETRKALEYMGYISPSTEQRRLFAKFARMHQPEVPFFSEVRMTMDWDQILSDLGPGGEFKVQGKALDTISSYMNIDPLWEPTAAMITSTLGLLHSDLGPIRNGALRVLLNTFKRGGDYSASDIFKGLIAQSDTLMNFVEAPQDRAQFLSSNANAAKLLSHAKALTHLVRTHPDLLEEDNHQALIDATYHRLIATVLLGLRREIADTSDRSKVVGEMGMHAIGAQVFDAIETIAPHISHDAKARTLEDIKTIHIHFINSATKVLEDIKEIKVESDITKYGIGMWSSYLTENVEHLQRLVKLYPDLKDWEMMQTGVKQLFLAHLVVAKDVYIYIHAERGLFDIYTNEELLAALRHLLESANLLHDMADGEVPEESIQIAADLSDSLLKSVEDANSLFLKDGDFRRRTAYGYASAMRTIAHGIAAYHILRKWDPGILPPEHQARFHKLEYDPRTKHAGLLTMASQPLLNLMALVDSPAGSSPGLLTHFNIGELDSLQQMGTETYQRYSEVVPGHIDREEHRLVSHVQINDVTTLTMKLFRMVATGKNVTRTDTPYHYVRILQKTVEWLRLQMDGLREDFHRTGKMHNEWDVAQKRNASNADSLLTQYASVVEAKKNLEQWPERARSFVSRLLADLKANGTVAQAGSPVALSIGVYEMFAEMDNMLRLLEDHRLTEMIPEGELDQWIPDREGREEFIQGEGEKRQIAVSKARLEMRGLLDEALATALVWFEDARQDGPLTGQYGRDHVLAVAFNTLNAVRDISPWLAPQGFSKKAVGLLREFEKHPEYIQGQQARVSLEQIMDGIPHHASLEYEVGERDITKVSTLLTLDSSKGSLMEQVEGMANPEKDRLTQALTSIRNAHPGLFELYHAKPSWKMEIVENYYRPIELRSPHHIVMDRRLLEDPELLAFLLVGEWMKGLVSLSLLDREIIGLKALGELWNDPAVDPSSMRVKLEAQFVGAEPFAELLDSLPKIRGADKIHRVLGDFVQEATPRLQYETSHSDALLSLNLLPTLVLGKWSRSPFHDVEVQGHTPEDSPVSLLRVLGNEFWVTHRNTEGLIDSMTALLPNRQSKWTLPTGNVVNVMTSPLGSPMKRVVGPLMQQEVGGDKTLPALNDLEVFFRTWLVQESQALGLKLSGAPQPGAINNLIARWKEREIAAVTSRLEGPARTAAIQAVSEDAEQRQRILSLLSYLTEFIAASKSTPEAYLLFKSVEILRNENLHLSRRRLRDLRQSDLQEQGVRVPWANHLIAFADELIDQQILWKHAEEQETRDATPPPKSSSKGKAKKSRKKGKKSSSPDLKQPSGGSLSATVLGEITLEKERVNKKLKYDLFKVPSRGALMRQLHEYTMPPVTKDVVEDIQLAGHVDEKRVADITAAHIEKILATRSQEDPGNVLVGLSDEDFTDATYEHEDVQIPLIKALRYTGKHWSDIVLRKYRKTNVAKYSIGQNRRLAKWMFNEDIPEKWEYPHFGIFERDLYDAVRAFSEIVTDYSIDRNDQGRHARQSDVLEAQIIRQKLPSTYGEPFFQEEFFDLMNRTEYVTGLASILQQSGVTVEDVNEQLFGVEKVDYKSREYRRKFVTRAFHELQTEGSVETILDITEQDFPAELFEESGLTLSDVLMETFSHLPLETLGIHGYPEIDQLRPFLFDTPERWQDIDNRVDAMQLFIMRFQDRGKELHQLHEEDFVRNGLVGFDPGTLLASAKEHYSLASIREFLRENPTREAFDAKAISAVVAKLAPHHLGIIEAGEIGEENFTEFKERHDRDAPSATGIKITNQELQLLLWYMREVRKARGWQHFKNLIHLTSREPLAEEEKERAVGKAKNVLYDHILVRKKIKEIQMEKVEQDIPFAKAKRIQKPDINMDVLRISLANQIHGNVLRINAEDTIQILTDDEEPVVFFQKEGEVVTDVLVVDAGEDYIDISLEGATRPERPALILDKQQKAKIRVVELAQEKGEMIERQILDAVYKNLARHRRSFPENSHMIDQVLRTGGLSEVELRKEYEQATTLFETLMQKGRIGRVPYKDLQIFRRLESDPSQKAAVLLGLMPRLAPLFHGPPGTGKTTVITATLLLHLAYAKEEKRELSILVASQANPAVDNVLLNLYKIYKQADVANGDMPFRRIAGSPTRMDPEIDRYFWMNPDPKVEKSVQFMQKHRRNIFFSTTMGSKTNAVARHRAYDLIIVDEATKAGTGQTLAPLVALNWNDETKTISDVAPATATKLIMVGDHKQLPPFGIDEAVVEAVGLTADEAEMLQRSPFESLMVAGHDQVLLSRNYRSRPPISILVSRLFYDGAIVPRAWDKDADGHPIVHERAFTLIDTARSIEDYDIVSSDSKLRDEIRALGKGEQRVRKSIQNDLEARIVIDQIYGLLKRGKHIRDILTIPPYRAQLHLIQGLLNAHLHKWYREDPQIKKQIEELPEYKAARKSFVSAGGDVQKFTIGDSEFFQPISESVVRTVDGSQGLENKIVILPFTRSNRDGTIGFLKDLNRLNVALSRGQEELIVIGDGETLLQASHTREDVQARKKFEAIWEYELEFQEMVAHYKTTVLAGLARTHAARPFDIQKRIKQFLKNYGDKEASLYGLVTILEQKVGAGETVNRKVMRELAGLSRVREGSLDWLIAFWIVDPSDTDGLIRIAAASQDDSSLEAAESVLKALSEEDRGRLGKVLLKSKDVREVHLAVSLLETLSDPALVPELLKAAERLRSPPLAKKIRLALNRMPIPASARAGSLSISRPLYQAMFFSTKEPPHGSGILLRGGLFLYVGEPPTVLSAPFRERYEELVKVHGQFLRTLLSKDAQTIKVLTDAIMTDPAPWEEIHSLFLSINPIAEDLRTATPADWGLRMLAFHFALDRVVDSQNLLELRGEHPQKIGRFMQMMEELTEMHEILSLPKLDTFVASTIKPEFSFGRVIRENPKTGQMEEFFAMESPDPDSGELTQKAFGQLPMGLTTTDFTIAVRTVEGEGNQFRVSHGPKPIFAELDLGSVSMGAVYDTGDLRSTQPSVPDIFTLTSQSLSEAEGIANIRRWLENKPTRLAPFKARLEEQGLNLGIIEGVPTIIPVSTEYKSVWVVPEKDSHYGYIFRVYITPGYDPNPKGRRLEPILEIGRREQPVDGTRSFNVGEQALLEHYHTGKPIPRAQFYPEAFVHNEEIKIGEITISTPGLPTGARVVLVRRHFQQSTDILVYEADKYMKESIAAARDGGPVVLDALTTPVAVYEAFRKQGQPVAFDTDTYFKRRPLRRSERGKKSRSRRGPRQAFPLEIVVKGPPVPVARLTMDWAKRTSHDVDIFPEAQKKPFDVQKAIKHLMHGLETLQSIYPDFIPPSFPVVFYRNLPYPIQVNSEDGVIEVNADLIEKSEFDALMLHHDLNHLKINMPSKLAEEVYVILLDVPFLRNWDAEMTGARRETLSVLRYVTTGDIAEQVGLVETNGDYADLLEDLEGKTLHEQINLVLDYITKHERLSRRLGLHSGIPRGPLVGHIYDSILAQAQELSLENFKHIHWGMIRRNGRTYEVMQSPLGYWSTMERVRRDKHLKMVRDIETGQVLVLKLTTATEADLLEELVHPNLIHGKTLLHHDREAVVSMPFIGDPYRVVSDDPYTFDQGVVYMDTVDRAAAWRNVLSGIQYLHQTKGVAYGDSFIKHLRLSKEGEPILIDFDAAKDLTYETAFSDLNVVAGEMLSDFPDAPPDLLNWWIYSMGEEQLIEFRDQPERLFDHFIEDVELYLEGVLRHPQPQFDRILDAVEQAA